MIDAPVIPNYCEIQYKHKKEQAYSNYHQALERAIKEGQYFKDVVITKTKVNPFFDVVFPNGVIQTLVHDKLYDIPEGYQVVIKNECSTCGAKVNEDCKRIYVGCSEPYEEYAVLEPLTKQEPEKCNGNCGMNYCDENGCIERKRILTEPCEPEDRIQSEREDYERDCNTDNGQCQICNVLMRDLKKGTCENDNCQSLFFAKNPSEQLLKDSLGNFYVKPESAPVIEQKEEMTQQASDFLKLQMLLNVLEEVDVQVKWRGEYWTLVMPESTHKTRLTHEKDRL